MPPLLMFPCGNFANIPFTGNQISFGNFIGKSKPPNGLDMTLPITTPVFKFVASSIQSPTNTSIASIGTPLITQSTVANQPTFIKSSNLPYLLFNSGGPTTGSYFSSTTMLTANYATNGGSSLILVINPIQNSGAQNYTPSFFCATSSSNTTLNSRTLETFYYNTNALGYRYYYDQITVKSTTLLPASTWSFIHATTSSTGAASITLNNSTIIGSGNGTNPLANVVTDKIYLNVDKNVAATFGYNSFKMYASVLYDRPLTAAEVTNAYNSVASIIGTNI